MLHLSLLAAAAPREDAADVVQRKELSMIDAVLLMAAVLLPPQEVMRWHGGPSETALSGRVVSAEGTPIPGVELSLRAQAPIHCVEIDRVISGADGRFRLQVGPFKNEDEYRGQAHLVLEATGYAPALIDRVPLPPPALELGDLALRTPQELTGLVTNGNGQSIAGAQIYAQLGYGSCPDEVAMPIAISDERGEFTCRALPPGLVTLGASAPGFADAVLDPVRLEDWPNRVRIELSPGQEVTLTILDTNEVPVPDARAFLVGRRPFWQERRHRGAWWLEQDADDEGFISITGVSLEFDAWVQVLAPGFVPSMTELSSRRVSLEPAPFLRVSAVRRSNGEPVEIHSVSIREASISFDVLVSEEAYWTHLWSDSPGVRVLQPNLWAIDCGAPLCLPGEDAPAQVWVTVKEGTQDRLYQFEDPGQRQLVERECSFPASASLSGRVVDASGAPVSLLLGYEIDSRRRDFLTTRSTTDGEFRFDRVACNGFVLRSLDERWEISSDCAPWALSEGQALEDAIVRVQPPSEGGVARVHVTIAGRPPGEHLLVAIDDTWQCRYRFIPRSFAWTDSRGLLEIRAREPGRYHLVPKHLVGAEVGGWRDFTAEFPAHDDSWPWTVEVPEAGVLEQSIDLLPEAKWNSLAPTKD
jgi:Carboxypeptidase regulatory-like domain